MANERSKMCPTTCATSGDNGRDTGEQAEELRSTLVHLLRAANDLCLAYGTAIRRVKDKTLARQLREIDGSHDRIRVELADCLCALGGTPPGTGDFLGVVGRGRVVCGELAGDLGILRAMAVNEEELSSAFRAERGRDEVPEKIRDILSRALEHEVIHKKFYDDALGRFVG